VKKEDILDSLEYIDEKYILEADEFVPGADAGPAHGKLAGRTDPEPEENQGEPDLNKKVIPIRRKAIPVRRWGTLAAGFAVFVMTAAVLS